MKITTGDILGLADSSMVLVVESVDAEASEIMAYNKIPNRINIVGVGASQIIDTGVLTVIQLTPVIGVRVGGLRRLSATEVGDAIHLGTLEERYHSARVMGFVGNNEI